VKLTAAALYFHDMQRDTITTLAYHAATDYVTYNIGIINQLLKNHIFYHTHHIWHPASILWELGAATWSRNIVKGKAGHKTCSLKITWDKCTELNCTVGTSTA
jgi:hypothetical protein